MQGKSQKEGQGDQGTIKLCCHESHLGTSQEGFS